MAQISAVPQPHMQQIDLTTLNIQQLSTLKSQLDNVCDVLSLWYPHLKIKFQELNLFQDSLGSLKLAQTKFQNSGETLAQITPESEGKEILVPLTGSVSFLYLWIFFFWIYLLQYISKYPNFSSETSNSQILCLYTRKDFNISSINRLNFPCPSLINPTSSGNLSRWQLK